MKYKVIFRPFYKERIIAQKACRDDRFLYLREIGGNIRVDFQRQEVEFLPSSNFASRFEADVHYDTDRPGKTDMADPAKPESYYRGGYI